MIKENNVIEDISWVACIKGKNRDPLSCAYRVAIDDQIKEFRKTQPSICVFCNKTNSEMHVDHIIHFEKLVLDFELINKLPVPKTFSNYHTNQKCFSKTDKEFEDSWKEFHKKYAQLRILCRECNSTIEKYKPEQNVSIVNAIEYIDDLLEKLNI